ncbi:hypothetical protein BT69DRAFT_1337863 [Atractiella rhizophila]|nr:hypothetical protein BT69DRAFT_1337863 [Atractiella rhizophila]
MSNIEIGSFALASASRKLSGVARLLAERVPETERITKLIEQHRSHEIITETDVEEAKQELHDAIEPQIENIVLKAENGLGLFQIMDKELRQSVALRQRGEETQEDLERLEQLRMRKDELLKELEELRS